MPPRQNLDPTQLGTGHWAEFYIADTVETHKTALRKKELPNRVEIGTRKCIYMERNTHMGGLDADTPRLILGNVVVWMQTLPDSSSAMGGLDADTPRLILGNGRSGRRHSLFVAALSHRR